MKRITQTITLTACCALVSAIMVCCKKNSTPTPSTPAATGPTAGMGCMRNWHRSHYYSASGMHYPTPVYSSYFLPDTSFAVTIVSDSTIQLLGNTYQYQQTDSAAQKHYFGTAYYYDRYGMGSGVIYFYAKDSIVHCYGDRHATSDQWTQRDLCYTY